MAARKTTEILAIGVIGPEAVAQLRVAGLRVTRIKAMPEPTPDLPKECLEAAARLAAAPLGPGALDFHRLTSDHRAAIDCLTRAAAALSK